MKKLSILLFLSLFCVQSHASLIALGDESTTESNIFPFNSDRGDRYQQIYDKSLFGTAPLTISSLSFFAADAGSLDVSFQAFISYTSRLVTDTGIKSFATSEDQTNLYDEEAKVGGTETNISIVRTLIAGEALTFHTDWLFDPNRGNLLVELVGIDFVSSTPVGINFKTETSDSNFSRIHNFGSGTGADKIRSDGRGLVASISAAVTSVPEPTTLGLICLALLGMLVRKNKLSKVTA